MDKTKKAVPSSRGNGFYNVALQVFLLTVAIVLYLNPQSSLMLSRVAFSTLVSTSSGKLQKKSMPV